MYVFSRRDKDSKRGWGESYESNVGKKFIKREDFNLSEKINTFVNLYNDTRIYELSVYQIENKKLYVSY